MTVSEKWLTDLGPATALPRAARRALTVRLGDAASALDAIGRAPRPEAVHALRVATRRADAALRIFGDLLPRRRGAWIRKALRRLRRAAGAVRDIDVMLGRHRAIAGDAPDAAWRAVFAAAATRRRRAARGLVACAERLRDKGFRARVEALLPRVRWRGEGDGAVPFVDAARARLAEPAARVLGGAADPGADDAALHALRIAAKRLRYAMELFGGAFDGAFRGAMYDEVEGLQEILGALNDHVTAAASLARRVARAKDPRVAARLRQLAAVESRSRDDRRRALFAWWTPERVRALAARFAERLGGQQ